MSYFNQIWSELGLWDLSIDIIVQTLVFMVIPVLMILILVSLIHRFTWKHVAYPPYGRHILIVFALMGVIPGEIAGRSQEAVTGVLLTGIVAVLSSLLAYIFSKDTFAEWRPILPFAIITFLLSTIIGQSVGRAYHVRYSDHKTKVANYDLYRKDVRAPVERKQLEDIYAACRRAGLYVDFETNRCVK